MSRTICEHWQVFGQTIRDGRLALNLPLRTCARMCGITHSYLCNLELGKVPPPSDTVLLKMSEHLGVPCHTLFAMAGRLPPDVQHALWSNLATPAFLATLAGMTLPDAQTFCTQVGKLLPVT